MSKSEGERGRRKRERERETKHRDVERVCGVCICVCVRARLDTPTVYDSLDSERERDVERGREMCVRGRKREETGVRERERG